MKDASDPKEIKAAKRAARQADAEREAVVTNLMSSPAGRAYAHLLLTECHVFASTFNASALVMAFAEGERNVGLRILADIVRVCPDQYIQMMREVNDRSNNDRPSGHRANGRGGNSGSEPDYYTDYDPDVVIEANPPE